MRILHIVGSLSLNNGVMNFIMNYYRNIDRNKIQFDFLYFKETSPNFGDEILELGGKSYFVNKPSIKKIISSSEEFNEFFRQHKNEYKIIHLHEIYLVHFIKIFAFKYGIKHLITHAHTTKYSDNPKNALRNRIMCLGLKYSANHYFACSKAAGSFYYGDKAVESGKVKIINNAIDIEKYKFNEIIRQCVRKELGVENSFVVGHIGRMSPQKNQIFLLEVFDKLLKFSPDSKLLIVGDGPLHNQLEKHIEKLNLKEKVILLGIRNDVSKLLMAMDVFCLPSLFEGLGIVAIEAQATGLNCVLSDVIPREVDMGKCKFLSLKDNSEIEWGKMLLTYGGNNRESMTNIIEASNYSIVKEKDKLIEIYRKILN